MINDYDTEHPFVSYGSRLCNLVLILLALLLVLFAALELTLIGHIM